MVYSLHLTSLVCAIEICASAGFAQSESTVAVPLVMGKDTFELNMMAPQKENFRQEASKYFLITPITQSILLGRGIRKEGVQEGSKQWLEENGKYVAGYVGLAYATHRFSTAFMEIDIDKFNELTDRHMKPNPQKVLYVNLIADGESLAGYAELEFQRQYRNHPNAKFIEAISKVDLLEKLKALPQDSAYERIEIFGHGSPGKLRIGKEVIDEIDLTSFKSADLKIAKPGADVRFLSCSLAGGRLRDSNIGERFVSEIGHAFLPEGGQVYAATRNIVAVKIPAARMIQHISGVSVITNVIYRMSPAITRDLRKARAGGVRFDIAPQAGCTSGFSALVKRLR